MTPRLEVTIGPYWGFACAVLDPTCSDTQTRTYQASNGMSLNVWAQRPQDNDIHILKVQGNVYMLVGPGGNTTVQIGANGVLVVDSQTADLSDKLIAAIKTLSDKPIRYVVNTSFDADRTGGNEVLARNGEPVVRGNLELNT